MKNYDFFNDMAYIAEALSMTSSDMAALFGVNRSTLSRWKKADSIPQKEAGLLYDHAFRSNLRINEVKEQIFKEEFQTGRVKVLFHGAKTDMTGDRVSLDLSKSGNDFGKGFYLGESFAQSAMFISNRPASSVYVFTSDLTDLKYKKYDVNTEWMITIAYCRGELDEYKDSNCIKTLISQLDGLDYLIAPIADNRMFEVINSFVSGEITDIQAMHCLSATNLGFQYVFLSDNAVNRLSNISRLYLSNGEREKYLLLQNENHKISEEKLRFAKRNYRNQGKYIEELLTK